MSGNNTAILNRLIKTDDDRDRFFHTSGYARALNGGSIGSSGGSAETFAARQAIEEKRRFVKRFNNSRVVNDGNALRRVSSTVLTGVKNTMSTREQLSRSAPRPRPISVPRTK